jgi:hypothetical protein
MGLKIGKKIKKIEPPKPTIPDCGYSFSIEAILCMASTCRSIRQILEKKTVEMANNKLNIPREVVEEAIREMGLSKFLSKEE